MRPAALPAAAAMLLAQLAPAGAQALRTAAIGCNAPADATRIATLQAHDKAGAAALAQPLVASRSCIDLAKGVRVDIDERKPPLACVRLSGDLSCYWIPAALVDEHPGEKGGGGGGRRGGRHR